MKRWEGQTVGEGEGDEEEREEGAGTGDKSIIK